MDLSLEFSIFMALPNPDLNATDARKKIVFSQNSCHLIFPEFFFNLTNAFFLGDFV